MIARKWTSTQKMMGLLGTFGLGYHAKTQFEKAKLESKYESYQKRYNVLVANPKLRDYPPFIAPNTYLTDERLNALTYFCAAETLSAKQAVTLIQQKEEGFFKALDLGASYEEAHEMTRQQQTAFIELNAQIPASDVLKLSKQIDLHQIALLKKLLEKKLSSNTAVRFLNAFNSEMAQKILADDNFTIIRDLFNNNYQCFYNYGYEFQQLDKFRARLLAILLGKTLDEIKLIFNYSAHYSKLLNDLIDTSIKTPSKESLKMLDNPLLTNFLIKYVQDFPTTIGREHCDQIRFIKELYEPISKENTKSVASPKP